MCGIAGIVDISGCGRVDTIQVRAMCATIRHRGPDGDGFYDSGNASLGMRRLAIIDVEGSDQPLYNEDRSAALVFNGEIYNYRELRAKLTQQGHSLRTDGDGETLLHLYEQHGLDLFRHLRGMYAFALWDAQHDRLVLAVDHIGMKPLYLYEHDGMLYFASEIKALVAAGMLTPSLRLEALDTYLSFGYMIGEDTLLDGVGRLLPGHALIVEKGRIRQIEYWRFAAANEGYLVDGDEVAPVAPINDEAAIISRARDLIQESVRIHLRSDVPLGLFLSGGVDSASMLALMSHEAGGRVQTYTVGYAADVPDNELAQARRIAAHFAADHHERIISADDWWGALQRYAYHHDEPNANPSAVSLMLLAEDTARHVKVVLQGLGGDELFGGYINHQAIPWLLAAQGRVNGLAWLTRLLGMLEVHYPALKRYRYVGALPTYLPRLRHSLMPRDEGLRRLLSFDGLVLSDSLREQLYGTGMREAWQSARHKEHTFSQIVARSWQAHPANTAQALIMNTWLHGNGLLSSDKVTMAHSLEARIPFFDPQLMAFAAAISPDVRMKANKHVLREAMRPYVPAFALERPKQPFSTPIRAWFDGPLQANTAAILLDKDAKVRAWMKPGALERVLQAHFDGRAKHEELVFRLLLLELWAQAFLTPVAAEPAGRQSISAIS